MRCSAFVHSLYSEFAMEEGSGGDEFMAIKPWIGAIVAPTAPPAANNSAPGADLSLEWVYGYRCFDARNNVHKLVTVRILTLLISCRSVSVISLRCPVLYLLHPYD